MRCVYGNELLRLLLSQIDGGTAIDSAMVCEPWCESDEILRPLTNAARNAFRYPTRGTQNNPIMYSWIMIRDRDSLDTQ